MMESSVLDLSVKNVSSKNIFDWKKVESLSAISEETFKKTLDKAKLRVLSNKIKTDYNINKNNKLNKQSIKFNIVDIQSGDIVHSYEIEGESFNVESIVSGIRIFHEKWSLIGEGKDLMHAETDLINEAKEFAKDFLKFPVSDLSIDALNLRDFLFRII